MRGLALICLALTAACGNVTADIDAAGDDDDDASAPDADPNAPDADPNAPDAARAGQCGGFAGLECPVTHWCDYEYDDCGRDDGLGDCAPRPSGGCPELYFPTCGCDGEIYGNDCEAQQAGTDVSTVGGCKPPEGMFPCGAHFCPLETQYCRVVISDVPSIPHEYSCQPMPSCPSILEPCLCLADEPCGDWCERDEYGGYTLTCPGG